MDETCWVKEVKGFAPFVPKVPERVRLLSDDKKVVDKKPVEIDAPAVAKYVQKGRSLCTVFPPHPVFCVGVLVSAVEMLTNSCTRI